MTRTQLIESLQHENVALKQENATLNHELSQLRKLIWSGKSERFRSQANPDQLSLFELDEPAEPDTVTEQISYERKKKKHSGRNSLPDHLPVQEVVIEPPVDTTEMEKIGEQVTETLEYTPASLVKKRTIRPKYVDKKTQTIHIAPAPVRPLPKSIAEAGLLSHILVSKYVDHLPLYRQAGMFSRDFGWQISQSTMNDWVKNSCALLQPLYDILIQKVLCGDYIQADESPMKVLEYSEKPGKSPPKKIMQGYQWVYYSPQGELVYFNYRKGRGKNGPKEILRDYKGYLQCDGYNVYDKIGSMYSDITLVGCLAHARRKFVEAQDSDPVRSKYVLGLFGQIYKAEADNQDQPITGREKVRKQIILSLMEQIKTWIETESIKVLPKSPIGKAMYYYQAQWPKLRQICAQARFRLDTNLIENKIRPLALGRKNYMFAGSHSGAHRAAMMYSFFGTCKQKEINPWIWLKNTLEKIAEHPINRIEELLPGYHNVKV